MNPNDPNPKAEAKLQAWLDTDPFDRCRCEEIRATHAKPAPDDPNQTPSHVKCPRCCLCSWGIADDLSRSRATPRRGELCHHCQHYLDACVCDKPQTRPTGPNPKNSEHAKRARELLRGTETT